MGILGKLLGDNAANVAATLTAVYLTGRLALPAQWLSGINIYRAGAATRSENDENSDDVLLGGAETVAQLRLSAASVSNAAFYEEWSTVVTALAVLVANLAADAAVAFFSPSPSSWRGTLLASTWALATALFALSKCEVEQARMLSSSWSRQLTEAAAAAAASSGVALFLMLRLSSSTSSAATTPRLLRLPSLDLDSWATGASRILHAATEIRVERFSRVAAALPLAVVAGALAPLLAGSAARGARAAAVATDAVGRRKRLGVGFGDLVYARSSLDRASLRGAALAAPLCAALLWAEPCARVWTSGGGKADDDDDSSAVASLRSLSLLAASALAALAARPAVEAHCSTALIVWWTRKHGFVARRFSKEKERKSGGGGGRGSGGGNTGDSTTTTVAARRRRAGEVLRLSMQFVNVFALKAGVQALAPALVWGACGAVALSPSTKAGGPPSPASLQAREAALWLGGWSAAVYSFCSLWHLVLYWCGWLTDVPSGGKR